MMNLLRTRKAAAFLLCTICLLFQVPTECFWAQPSRITNPLPSFHGLHQHRYHPINASLRSRQEGSSSTNLILRRHRKNGPLFLADDSLSAFSSQDPQPAFLALLKLSKILAATKHKKEKKQEEEPFVPSFSSLEPPSEGRVDYHLALPLAVGAAKAFSVMERNLLRAINKLGTLHESLRQMASKQSDLLVDYVAHHSSGSSLEDDKHNGVFMQECVASVRHLVTMDKELNHALSGLYQLGNSLKKKELVNNELIATLLTRERASASSTSLQADIQPQAKTTLDSFEEIDAKLSHVLTDVREIVESFKDLELSNQQSKSRLEAETLEMAPKSLSESDIANIQAYVPLPKSVCAPFSPLPSPPSMTPTAVSSPQQAADVQGSSSVPFSHHPEATSLIEQMQQDNSKIRVESALRSSIAVAHAFDTMDAEMVLKGQEILAVLEELRASVQRLVDIDDKKATTTTTTRFGHDEIAPSVGHQQSFAAGPVSPSELHIRVAPFQQSLLSPPSSSPPAPSSAQQQQQDVATGQSRSTPVMPSPMKSTPPDLDSVWEESRKLSQAAAEAWETVDRNMASNDAKTLSILHQISESFRTLANSDKIFQNFLHQTPSPRSLLKDRADATVQVTIPLQPKTKAVSSPDSTVASSPLPAVSVPPLPPTPHTHPIDEVSDSRVEYGKKIALDAANAFNEINENVSHHHISLMSLLHDLKDSLKRIVSAEKLSSPPKIPPPPQVAPSLDEEPVHCAILDNGKGGQALIPEKNNAPLVTETVPVTAALEKRKPEEPQRNTDESTALYMGMAEAFTNVDNTMNTNNDNIIAILRDISFDLRSMLNTEDTSPSRVTLSLGESTSGRTSGTVFTTSSATSSKPNLSSLPEKLLVSVPTELPAASSPTVEVQKVHFQSAWKHPATPGFARQESADIPTRSPDGKAASVQTSYAREMPSSVDQYQKQQSERLTMETVKAFQEVDATMNRNDKKTISVLQQIRASLDRLNALESTAKDTTDTSLKAKQGANMSKGIDPLALGNASTSLEAEGDADRPRLAAVRNAPITDKKATETHQRAGVDAHLEDANQADQTDFAKKLAIVETAKAFQAMDASMVKNDEKTLTLLEDINSSLKRLVKAADVMDAKTVLGEKEVRIENSATRAGPAPPTFQVQAQAAQPADVDGIPPDDDSGGGNVATRDAVVLEGYAALGYAKRRSESIDHVKVLQERAVALSLQAARAFSNVDATMTQNDERILSILGQINSSFQRIVEHDKRKEKVPAVASKVLSRPTVPNIPSGSVLQRSLGQSVTAPLSTIREITNEALQEEAVRVKTREEEDARAKAYQLSVEAARLLASMDSTMTSNDQQALALLKEIKESFAAMADVATSDRLSSLEGHDIPRSMSTVPAAQLSNATVPPHSPSGDVSQLPLAKDVTAAVATTAAITSEVAQEEAARQEEDAGAKAHQLSVEAAHLLTCMDSAMTSNDQQMLVLLKEIKESFAAMAIAASSPSQHPSSLEGQDVPLSAYKAPADQHPQTASQLPVSKSVLNPPSPPVQQKDSVPQPLPVYSAIQETLNPTVGYSAVAQAFENVNRDMSQNDALIIQEFREMSSLFQRLAAEDDSGVMIFNRILPLPTSVEEPDAVLSNPVAVRNYATPPTVVRDDTPKLQQDGSSPLTAAPLVSLVHEVGVINIAEDTSAAKIPGTHAQPSSEDAFSSNLEKSIEAAEALLALEENKEGHKGESIQVLTQIVSSLRELKPNITYVPLYHEPVVDPLPPKPEMKRLPSSGATS